MRLLDTMIFTPCSDNGAGCYRSATVGERDTYVENVYNKTRVAFFGPFMVKLSLRERAGQVRIPIAKAMFPCSIVSIGRNRTWGRATPAH